MRGLSIYGTIHFIPAYHCYTQQNLYLLLQPFLPKQVWQNRSQIGTS